MWNQTWVWDLTRQHFNHYATLTTHFLLYFQDCVQTQAIPPPYPETFASQDQRLGLTTSGCA